MPCRVNGAGRTLVKGEQGPLSLFLSPLTILSKHAIPPATVAPVHCTSYHSLYTCINKVDYNLLYH